MPSRIVESSRRTVAVLLSLAVLTCHCAHGHEHAERETVECDPASIVCAAANGRMRDVRDMIARGADVNRADHRGDTALYWASFRRFADIAALLIASGARDSLVFSAARGDRAAVERFLETRVPIDRPAHDGKTALIWAACKNHIDIVTLLVDRGARINIADRDGITALGHAIASNRVSMAKLLLDRGADPNGLVEDDRRITALMYAVYNNMTGTMRMMIARGVDLNARAADGRTALMEACELGREDAVRLLIDAGASIHARAHNGATALSVARGNVAIERLLRAAGAREN